MKTSISILLFLEKIYFSQEYNIWIGKKKKAKNKFSKTKNGPWSLLNQLTVKMYSACSNGMTYSGYSQFRIGKMSPSLHYSNGLVSLKDNDL